MTLFFFELVPFLLFVAMAVFHLDEAVARRPAPRGGRFCGLIEGENWRFTDPDGRAETEICD